MQTTKDLYKVLGISREASQDDIRKAHRNLVRQYHPDANPKDPTADERFKEVQHAYEVLSNEKKRQEYDKQPYTSSRAGRSGRPGTRRAAQRTKTETTSAVDLSDLLSKLKDVFENARSGSTSATDEDVSGRKPSGVSNKPREKKVKGPKAQGKEKRVKGPSARRKRKSN